MSDSCRIWRDRLSERTDGLLTAEQRDALEKHLNVCRDCREAEAADSLRNAVMLCSEVRPMDASSARAFDDAVIARMKALQPTLSHRVFGWAWARERYSALPIDLMRQITGGALIAASLTIICLCTSLSSLTGTSNTTNSVAPTTARSEVPVPLDTLLRVSEPRAALLWSNPSAANRAHTYPAAVHPMIRPAASPNTPSPLPGRHSSAEETPNLS